MSRIRTIKPEFWTSAQVMECSPLARLFFIGLWNFCDDHGRHPTSEKQLKALIFPGDDFPVSNVRRLIDELNANELIILYVVDGKEYLSVVGWRHQKIDKPQLAKFPAPESAIRGTVVERSPNGIDGREGKGEEGKNNPEPLEKAQPLSEPATPVADPSVILVDFPSVEKHDGKRKRIEYPPGFVRLWNEYPVDANMSKTKAFAEWSKLTRADKEMVLASLRGFNAYCQSHADYRPVHAERYLKERRFEGHAEAAAKLSEISTVYVPVDSPQWKAWVAYNQRQGRGPPPTDKKGGWRFPSEYPPTSDNGTAA